MTVRRRKKVQEEEKPMRDWRPVWRAVILRHRAPGHLRFDLPPPLRTAVAAETLEAGLRAIDGVYRATVIPRVGKLSIRYVEAVCGTGIVAARLAALVGEVMETAEGQAAAAPPAQTGDRSPASFDAKEWTIHFLNDLVAFYLIRIHWGRITRQWLPNPWSYRYEWLTMAYLTFLLVRYRKTSAARSRP